MLVFVGLGLFDEDDVTVQGKYIIENADKVYAEFYTSSLTGTDIETLELSFSSKIERLSRHSLEKKPDEVLESATENNVALLVGGDPMISTTHADLRIRAKEKGIDTRIIHSSSIETAVKGETGLQNYRFGPPTTLPFSEGDWKPKSPMDTIKENLERDLHTLVYLDIKHDDPSDEPVYMTIEEAVDILYESSISDRIEPLIGCSRIGSDNQKVAIGSIEELKTHDFGEPLHVLIVPSDLHEVEKEYLESFAD